MGSHRMLVVFGAAALAATFAACSAAPTAPDPESAVTPATQPSQAGPSIQLKVPEDSPGPPFYAISGNGGFIPHDSQWAAIPFVRELGCIPASQDLLVVAAPAAFGCTLTVHGHEHWQNGPGIDPAPRQTQLMGSGAVPIVFALWSEVQAASVGGLTRAELLGLPSAIVGTADFYKETNVLGISGPHGAGKGSYKINARGTLADTRPFSLHVNEVLGELRVVEIAFAGSAP